MSGSLETVDANVDADRERVELHRLQALLTVSEQLNQIRGTEQRAMDKHPRTVPVASHCYLTPHKITSSYNQSSLESSPQ
jgi:hypothetical protein